MLVNGNLRVVHAVDAYATPFNYDARSRTHTGAIYDAFGRRVDMSERHVARGAGRINPASPTLINVSTRTWNPVEGRSLYLGHWMAHYGHWLLESLSAFWSIDRIEFDQVLFHPFKFGSARRKYTEFFLHAHNIDPGKVILLEEPRSLEYVAVPERSYAPSYSMHEVEFRRPFNRLIEFAGRRSPQGRKVFVSRSMIKRRRREPVNRQEVDNIAVKLGFELVFPEKMSIREQIDLYQETEVLCGFNGSGLHNSLFMHKGLVIEIGDQVRMDKGPITQQQCNHAAGVDYAFIPFVPTQPGCIDLGIVEAGIRKALAGPRAPPPQNPWKVWQT